MVEHLSDEQLARMRLGGHDPIKVHAAYRAAVDHTGAPTIILAKTIKGYGLGEAGEGKNITHQQKKLNEDELEMFRSRFGIPIPDDELHEAPFYRPCRRQRRNQVHAGAPPATRRIHAAAQSPRHAAEAISRLSLRRVPQRHRRPRSLDHHGVRAPAGEAAARSGTRQATSFPSFPTRPARSAWKRSSGRSASIPASARTTNRSTWTRSFTTRKRKNGQILEEGITEAGSMCSFIAAGTAYANHGINTIPFFIYYSMFGFQRIGDLIWAAADMRCRGFLIGGTAGRTTLAGEGLQHQDGHSHVLALAVPNLHGLRSGVRLRDRHHHSGWHQAHVCRSGIDLLLPDRHQRTAAHARDACGRQRSRRHPERPVSLQGVGEDRCEAAGTTARQRHHHVRGA